MNYEELKQEIESINELTDQKVVQDLKQRLMLVNINNPKGIEVVKLARNKGII